MKKLTTTIVVALFVTVPVCLASVPAKRPVAGAQPKNFSCLEDPELAQLLGVLNRRPESSHGLQTVTVQMNKNGHVKSVTTTPSNCEETNKPMLGELKRLKLGAGGTRAKTIKVTFLPAPPKRLSSN